MRRIGYRVVDEIVEHFESLSNLRAATISSRASLEAKLREPIPEHPEDINALLDQLRRDVWSSMSHVTHPRFFAFIPEPSNFVGAMADALAAGINPFVGTWIGGSGPAQIELVTIDWLSQLCGLPTEAGGLFVSGGSMANLTALAVARYVKLDDRSTDAIIYCSDQTHSCVERALRVLGFANEQIVKIASDEAFRLPVAALRQAIERDRAAGRRPFCVVANAGTVNTGAIDPLDELARLCQQQNLWLHVDGAYGAAAVLCERGRRLLNGIERADSLALDPHKWLFQPFEIGCVLVRDGSLLKKTFRILPEYLADTQLAEEQINFCDHGIQLTRGFRALKLWLSFKAFGVAAFREAIQRGIEMAEFAEGALRGAGRFEIVSPATLGIVAFRFVPRGASEAEINEVNRKLVGAMVEDGFTFASSTTIRGQIALRLVTINPRTTEDDVRASIARIEQLGDQIYWRIK
ncbi:MAG: pyridoxal phosphate-dependent decarboxylase family protein [Blastocatellia bacterium]